ncbi:Peptidoglycan glycosyltransferase MrdB [Acaryochloris thomasi RCC1774]|uniref:Peptidoglycan glycosyltransferase RodA n=1 Tax=Acaryochloris thomasi RCC1774 TaxID=1764569 RepID=A0A2W1JNB0_9CYAN|nr:rod shape-determining protein RodA [Acaryochloris thomasi]PZD72392.1 Peptidoglycan glycosyltransferase MrdB [Acaryochloris thomasi RCC1774]
MPLRTRSNTNWLLRALSPWKDIDQLLLILPMGIMALGAVMIRSTQQEPEWSGFWVQHLTIGFVGLALALLISRLNYRNLLTLHWLTYLATNAALLAVIFIGTSALGAQRWIPIAGFNVQPSEFAKVGVIITLSALLSQRPATSLFAIARTFAVLLLPWGLVFVQPDLGTSLVFGAIALGMLYWANAKLGWIILMISPIVSAIVLNMALQAQFHWGFGAGWLVVVILIGWFGFPRHLLGALGGLLLNLAAAGLGSVLWGLLQDYQKARLVLFLNPDQDPLGGGYHLIQSRIAIGAGGLWGTGLNQGTQTKLDFIPEQHTDFIFSAAAEELGFIGSALILLAFWLICFRLVRIALLTTDDFGSLIVMGIFSMVIFQVVINIGMNIGLAPVTGLPLPWMSYGRSALLTNFIAIGLAESVASHRPKRRLGMS